MGQPGSIQDIYEQTLQIKQNITPAHVIHLSLLLSMLSFTCNWPFQNLTVKKERETEQREI
jgi:hypothetical protein